MILPILEATRAVPADRPWLAQIVETSEAVISLLGSRPAGQLPHPLLMQELPPTLSTGVLAAAVNVLVEEQLVATYPVGDPNPVMMVVLTANGRILVNERRAAERFRETS